MTKHIALPFNNLSILDALAEFVSGYLPAAKVTRSPTVHNALVIEAEDRATIEIAEFTLDVVTSWEGTKRCQ